MPSAYPSSKPWLNPASHPSRVADSTSAWLTTMPRAGRDDTVPRSAGATFTCTPWMTRPRASRVSDDKLITASRHVDLAGFLERANHADDAGLRLFDGL